MNHPKSHKTARTGDTYMNQVRRFPLKTIKNDVEHEEATRMISELMGHDLDSGAGDYLDALLVLVNKYEDEHHAIDETMTPQQALRSLMESNTLSQADIGRIIGSEMRQNACTAPAPSTRAASYRSSGTDWSAARMTIADSGVICQTCTISISRIVSHRLRPSHTW